MWSRIGSTMRHSSSPSMVSSINRSGGFLTVSEGGSEVDVEIDRLGDRLHAKGFRLQ